ncbi:hypothetical protein C0216_16910 [Streptomyces globosus]|uniref:DUF5655 domain-containing protein n=1 Tax=Streptomyces globosus TaxID=68209 RepID=A0A344U1Y7_9ACTN|nr:DUF5655 domain-containing protein [Streptomyces globosus]AXE24908.1 hypothetical protein C0216_16910 [Streptomyces globosus]
MAGGGRGDAGSPEEFFEGCDRGLALYEAVAEAVAALGSDATGIRVTRSQIAFRRRRGFAWVWRPDRYVRSSAPAVLSIALPCRVESDRFKSVVHPAPDVWMHHIELYDPAEVDAEVRAWLAAAHRNAA